ncbi:MAG: hypothetical protein Q8N39_07575 [Pelolinea sp.]|nr:hypothetical protein [Pelolinea sp.]
MSQNKMPSPARQFGYIIAIAVNIALIYIANNLLNWNVPFLTKDYTQCLWAVNLSLGVTIFINFIFIFFDRKWFKNLMQAFGNVFAFISGFIFWRVFPLNLSDSLARIVNFALIIALGAIVLSAMIELVGAVRNYNRANA